jgi:hypothetical protein
MVVNRTADGPALSGSLISCESLSCQAKKEKRKKSGNWRGGTILHEFLQLETGWMILLSRI